MSSKTQSGFSLIELLIAMVVTLIVTGSIYGLIAGGQSAFTREPELVERQQNIRMAMDLLARDIGAAGVGMTPAGATRPMWIQTFSITSAESGGALESCVGNSSTLAGQGPCLASTIGAGNTDDLEILANPNGRPSELACSDNGSHTGMLNNHTFVEEDGIAIWFMRDGTWTIRQVENSFDNNGGTPLAGAPPGCAGGGNLHAELGYSTGRNSDPTLNCSVNLCHTCGIGTAADGRAPAQCIPMAISSGQVITYHVRADAEGMPSLWRRATGSIGGGGFANSHQLIARGIEDMQIQYRTAGMPAGTFADGAPAVVAPIGAAAPGPLNYGSLITEVRVTLSARTTNRRLAGASRDDAGTTGSEAVRGRLTSTMAIRATLNEIAMFQGAGGLWQ